MRLNIVTFLGFGVGDEEGVGNDAFEASLATCRSSVERKWQ
jgi:hypothetical protein